MSDLVKRLRDLTEGDFYNFPASCFRDIQGAADRIEALEAEVQRLRGEGSDTSHNRFHICGYQRRPKWHWPKAEWTACSSQEATGHFDRAPSMEYRPIYAAMEPTNE